MRNEELGMKNCRYGNRELFGIIRGKHFRVM